MSQFTRDIEAHLKKVDRGRILELLSKVDENAEGKVWRTIECGANGGECWCRMVVTDKCDPEDGKWPDPECVVTSGCLSKPDAEFLAEIHNVIPSVVALRDLLETPTWCGRCGRGDLKLWMTHEHLKSCMSTTDDEHELNRLKQENEELRTDNRMLRIQLGAIDG